MSLSLLGCAESGDFVPRTALEVGDVAREKLEIQSPSRISGYYGDYLVARHAEKIADFTTASDILYRLWREEPKNDLLGYGAVLNAQLSGEYDRVLEVAHALRRDSVVSLMPSDQNAVAIVLALEHLKFGRYEAAIEEVETPLALAGIEQYVTPLIIAWAHVGLGEVEEGLRFLEEAQQQSAVRNIYWLNTVYIDIYRGAYSEAAERLRGLLDTLEHPPMPMSNLYAHVLFWSAGAATAENYVHTLPPSEPRDELEARLRGIGTPPAVAEWNLDRPASALAEGLNELNKLLRGGAPKKGLFYAQAADYLDPDNAASLLIVGDILFGLGRYKEALAALDRVRDSSLFVYREVTTLAAEIEQRMGRADQAIARMEQAIAQFPNDSGLLFELGQIYQHEKNFSNAIVVYSRTIAQRTDWSDYYFRGIAYERTGQWSRAEQDFLRALELSPNNAYVLNYLGYSWIDQRMNIPRALEMLKYAVELSPNNAFIIDSYGWALYRVENFDEAVKYLEHAVLMVPAEAVINDHLGDVYWHLGRKIEAGYQWERALTLEIEKADDRIRIEEKIAGNRFPKP